MPAYVVQERDDGRLDLSFRPAGSLPKLVETASLLLAALYRAEADGGALALGDASSPAEIRRELGVSKATFKAARGHLLRRAPASPPRALAHPTPRPTSANLIARGSVESAGGPRATQQEQTAQRRSNPPRACFGTCPRRFAPAAHPPPRTRETAPRGRPLTPAPLPPSPPARLGLLQRPLPSHETALVSGAAGRVAAAARRARRHPAPRRAARRRPGGRRGRARPRDGAAAALQRARRGVRAARASHRRLLTIGPRFGHVHRRGGRRRGARGARRVGVPARVRRAAGGRRHDQVFVGNLPDDASDDDLWDVFGDCGYIKEVEIERSERATRAASAASRSSPPTVPPPPSASRARRSAARASASSRLSARRRRRRCRPPPPAAAAAWAAVAGGGGDARPLGGGEARARLRDGRCPARRARGGGRAPRGREAAQGPAARRRGRPFPHPWRRPPRRTARGRAAPRTRAPRRRRRAALAQEWGRVVVHALHIV